MWELDHNEGWGPKNWCFWTVVLEETLESPLDCREVKPVHPKGNQSWIFIRRTDAEAEAPVLWPPNVKSWVIRKDPDAGKDWRQEENGMTEDEMVGWHHRLSQREFEQGPRDGEGQGSLACYNPLGHKKLDTTEWLTATTTLFLFYNFYWGIVDLQYYMFKGKEGSRWDEESRDRRVYPTLSCSHSHLSSK